MLANFNISKRALPLHSSYFWQDLELLMMKRRFAILLAFKPIKFGTSLNKSIA